MIYLTINTPEEKILAEKLYDKYSKFMFKIAYSVLNDKFSAEEAVQQSFVRIIKSLDKIDAENEQKTRNFIGVITKHIAIDMYNKEKNQAIGIDDEALIDESTDILQIIIDKETIARLKIHIKELKPTYQTPLLLNVVQRFTVNEIAKILDLNPRTVQKRLERARAMLIKSLNREEN